MSPDLNDTDLERELRRRAEGARLRTDWARFELLATVRSGLDSRIDRVPSPRLAPLGGIAAVAAVLVLLIVALPRFVPGPQSTADPSPTAVAGPVVLSTEDFNNRLAAGALLGSTVLVNGRIEPGSTLPRPNCLPSAETCFMGMLVGTEPALSVSAAMVQTTEDDENRSTVEGEEFGWHFWWQPQPPVEGILALSVRSDGRVEYVGRVRSPSAELTWSASDASELDLHSLAIDEIVLVDGWLTGLGGLISGVPPQPGTFIGGLPQRYSGSPSWVLDEPVVLDPNGYQEPEGGIRVQNNAYYEFAANPAPVDAASPTLEPRRAAYALTKRLEGGGCPGDAPPCLQWNVVGRLSGVGDVPTISEQPSPEASPTAASGRRFECVGPPLPPESTPPAVSVPVVIVETGLIVSCAQTDYLTEMTDEVTVSNPFGTDSIEVIWEAEPCDSEMTLTFRAVEDRYELAGERPAGQSNSTVRWRWDPAGTSHVSATTYDPPNLSFSRM